MIEISYIDRSEIRFIYSDWKFRQCNWRYNILHFSLYIWLTVCNKVVYATPYSTGGAFVHLKLFFVKLTFDSSETKSSWNDQDSLLEKLWAYTWFNYTNLVIPSKRSLVPSTLQLWLIIMNIQCVCRCKEAPRSCQADAFLSCVAKRCCVKYLCPNLDFLQNL